MKQIAAFNQIFASLALTLILSFSLFSALERSVSYAQEPQTGTCSDNIDNDKDGRADWDGVPEKNWPPDPSCVNANSEEVADDVKSKIIPCTNKCDLGDVFALINNLIEFLIKVILFPIIVLMFLYAGFKYITAQGSPDKKIKIRRMIGNIILGMVIILTAWVVVKTVLVVIGYQDNLYFFE